MRKLDRATASVGGTSESIESFIATGVAHIVLHPNAQFTSRLALCKLLKLDPDSVGALHFSIDFQHTLWHHVCATTLCISPADIDLLASPPEELAYIQSAEVKVYEAKLFAFMPGLTRRQMRRKIYAQGWIPAEPLHMLAFSTKYNTRHDGPVKFDELIVGLGKMLSTLAKLHPSSDEWSHFKLPKQTTPSVLRSALRTQYLAVREAE